jgi:hypothetical protein
MLRKLPAPPAVRTTPSWPRSWANSSLLSLYSYGNAWANLHLLGEPCAIFTARAPPEPESHASINQPFGSKTGFQHKNMDDRPSQVKRSRVIITLSIFSFEPGFQRGL